MDEEQLIIGWPFTDHLPMKIGEVDGIAWAIAANDNTYAPCVNGYARIPWEGHPWSGLEAYDDIQVDIDVHGGLTYGPSRKLEWGKMAHELAEETKDGPSVPFNASFIDSDYTRPAVTFQMVGGWIGFDTNHAFDYWSDEALANAHLRRERLPGDPLAKKPSRRDPYAVRWSVAGVIAQAESLAAQIAKAGR